MRYFYRVFLSVSFIVLLITDNSFSDEFESFPPNLFLQPDSTTVIGSANFLSRITLSNINLNDISAMRTTYQNEKDIRLGIRSYFALTLFSQVSISVRDHFGSDHFELREGFVRIYKENLQIETGVLYPQIGHNAHFFNLDLDRQFWNTGLIYDHRLTGIKLTFPGETITVETIMGTNRQPSFDAILRAYFKLNRVWHLAPSLVYLERDPDFHDRSPQMGLEFSCQPGGNIRVTGIGALKHYTGRLINDQQERLFLFAEIEWQISKKWSHHLAVFSKKNWRRPYPTTDGWFRGNKNNELNLYNALNMKFSPSFQLKNQIEYLEFPDYCQVDYTQTLVYQPHPGINLHLRGRVTFPEIGHHVIGLSIGGYINFD